jgi:uncharacterized protein
MESQDTFSESHTGPLRRRPVLSYFVLTFTVSWICALLVATPDLLRHQPLTKLTAILMFPAMLVGPSGVGIFLTRYMDGREGIRKLFARIAKWHVSWVWYTPLLVPPLLVLGVLFTLKSLVSPAYASNRFWMGVFFGLPAGFLEEIGWMGYAFPKMGSQISELKASILLGLLWSTWHLPVVDYLGAASPHGVYWFPFFLAFAASMTAMRVIICWIYSKTESVLLAQFMHVSSTGALVVFGAAHVTAAQEVTWYGVYAITLWIIVSIVAKVTRWGTAK